MRSGVRGAMLSTLQRGHLQLFDQSHRMDHSLTHLSGKEAGIAQGCFYEVRSLAVACTARRRSPAAHYIPYSRGGGTPAAVLDVERQMMRGKEAQLTCECTPDPRPNAREDQYNPSKAPLTVMEAYPPR